MNLSGLKALFRKAGCIKLYVKPLAANDNSKNQVYFGPGFAALNIIPNEGAYPGGSREHSIFKARVHFAWLLTTGHTADAPNTQLILYPQYPEVRLSGFLMGCPEAPSALMTSREKNRLLFLGVMGDRRILAHVTDRDSEIAREFRAMRLSPTLGVFIEVDMPRTVGSDKSQDLLLAEFARIHNLGWIDSKQLSADGSLRPCYAPQCGGFTLEAEMGIPKNSRAEPDFHGWEVKQHSVPDFEHLESGVITLMTAEPDGGYYARRGLERFIRRFGYEDMRGRADRLNFGGIHRVNKRNSSTQLTLKLIGYNSERDLITDSHGALALLTDRGEMAATWEFSGLMTHWTRKHAKAAYVPSLRRKEPRWQYSFGPKVRLARETDFLRFLKALSSGAVFYDPGIKLEKASTLLPSHKARSQFRITSRSISALYEIIEVVTVCK